MTRYTNIIAIVVPLLFSFTSLCGVDAYVRSANEGHFPYVVDTLSTRGVVWARGSLLQRVLGASAVRMTDNRIRFIPAGWTVIANGDTGMQSVSCKPCVDALCRVWGSELFDAMGVGIGSLILPVTGVPVFVHGNTSHICKDGVGRTSEASDIGLTRYDISVCDVVDGPVDILFAHDRVFLAYVNVDTSLYVVTGLVVVVVIVLITQNLAVDILTCHGTDESAVPTWFCVLLSLSLTFCSCILPGVFNGVGPGFFVPISTLFDWGFFYLIVFYMSVHCFLWVLVALWTRFIPVVLERVVRAETKSLIPPPTGTATVSYGTRVGELHSVNLMVCSLLLAIFSTHGTIETVLTSPLLFVFMFRTIFKSYAVENSFTNRGQSESYTQVVFEPLLIALDIVVIGAIHVVGMMSFAETTLHAHTGFVIMFFIAHTFAFESNRSRRKVA